jgi:hypothetical protein
MMHTGTYQVEPIAVGDSSGTTPVMRSQIGHHSAFIAIENVAMIGAITLEAAPNQPLRGVKSGLRAAVVASLERSLTEHADVWAELSRY